MVLFGEGQLRPVLIPLDDARRYALNENNYGDGDRVVRWSELIIADSLSPRTAYRGKL